MTLLLVCVFNSTLGTASWDSDGQAITSGGPYYINTSFNETASVYVTTLTIDAASTSELMDVVTCHLHSLQRVETNGAASIVNTNGGCGSGHYHYSL